MMRILGFTLTVVLFNALIGQVNAAPKYDYCQMFKGELVLFAVDRSDFQDLIDKEIGVSAADKIFHELSAGDHLVVYTITDDQTTSKKIFDACKPGCPEVGFFDQLLGTCREVVARKDEVAFRQDFAVAIYNLFSTPEEHDGSAIIETISALGNQYAGIDRLILFSDLIENSKLGNFLKIPQRDFKKVQMSVQTWRMVPNLDGAKGYIFGFGRTHGENRKGLPPERVISIEDFWRAYFEAAGMASLVINQRY